MSVATLEQETLVVMTELADEEISGIVGGRRGDFKAKKIDIDIDVKSKVSGGKYSRVANGTSIAVAFNGDAKANVDIDQSNDRAYFK
ncbi:hypothetical protein [Nostoc sp. MG11]|uniref:hypothetical protein n=1 Tax=Nostoc sp. MG11 TaxID=2721166 RepID=UPI00186722F9|nr:hypothetical protein [Nostoc sp. MG11]